MLFFPNAKINIGLNITEKRPDGFHNIETVFYPIGLCDILEFTEIKDPSKGIASNLISSGIYIGNNKNENLCIKAYYLFKNDFNLPKIDIHLHKKIPIGAGLGGGSSDSAFMLRKLNEYFQLNLSNQKLNSYADKLGSDCTFFIENKPVFAVEKGNKLKIVNLNLSDYYIMLVYPNIHINTSEAFSKINTIKPDSSLEKIVQEPIENWKNLIKNDFEPVIFKKHPIIEEIKNKLYSNGAIYASMSGSGSAVYGIFKDIPKKNKFNNYFVWQGKLKNEL